MFHISIISSSIRTGRKSHNVALFFKNYIQENGLASCEILDLKEFNFPIFDEVLSKIKDPSTDMLDFAGKIKKSDGVLIVTPEYNGGYPASLKNAIDLLYPEWKRKPVALATVSNGSYAGTQVMTSLVFTLWKMGCLMVPAMFRVAKVQDNYSDTGQPMDPQIPKHAKSFLDELMWCMEAGSKTK